MDIELFLAHTDGHDPVLVEGIARNAGYDVPIAVIAGSESSRFAITAAPPDALVEQRWAIVAPEGTVGDRLLQLIAPLRKKREQEQGADALVYRVDPGMGCADATRWIQRDWWDAVGRREEHVPRYLLLLGGPELISWELQQLLGGEAFVGRLAFAGDRGYEAYAQKVLRWERDPPAPGARALFYTVRDGTGATTEGYLRLMLPSLEIARDRKARGWFPATEIVEIGSRDVWPGDKLVERMQEMLHEAEQTRAGLLFTISHGAGIPRAGWTSPDEQRACQGGMVIGGHRLTPSDVAKGAFLRGGVWFLFACYGAGTPAQSAYLPWLDRLHRLGRCSSAERVLAALPKQGDPPFVAALPQAALANPDGPLGVIGHVDLAWTWSFLDRDFSVMPVAAHARAERFQGVLRALVNGHRFGVAHYELARFFRSISTELSALYDEHARRGVAIESDTAKQAQARLATLWMQRQDICAYVLLGDPAARLPIVHYPAGVPPGGVAGLQHRV